MEEERLWHLKRGKPELHRIDEKTQERLFFLMGKNNEGKLSDREARELAELGDYAEKLSLENARILAAAATAAKKRNPNAHQRTAATAIPVPKKSRRKVDCR